MPILNVTVIAGQTAVLPCSIDNLGKHKVSHSLMDVFFIIYLQQASMFPKYASKLLEPFWEESQMNFEIDSEILS